MRRGIFILGAVSFTTALTLSTLVLSSRSDASTHEVAYHVKDSDHNFEVREYAPRIVAEVEASGTREKALNEAFQTLAGYLFGKNSPQSPIELSKSVSDKNSKVKLSMTLPVTTQSVGPDTIRMRFLMPSDYTIDKLPVPEDKRVKVFELPAQKIAVLRFSGSARKDNFDRHLETLKEYMEAKGLTAAGDPYEAYYNPPFTPIFLKRNEICVPL